MQSQSPHVFIDSRAHATSPALIAAAHITADFEVCAYQRLLGNGQPWLDMTTRCSTAGDPLNISVASVEITEENTTEVRAQIKFRDGRVSLLTSSYKPGEAIREGLLLVAVPSYAVVPEAFMYKLPA